MRYRVFGKTGLCVSVLGFGGSPLGGGDGGAPEEQAIAAVRSAVEQGISVFDTAGWYGQSEDLIGRALGGVSREKYFLATKVGLCGEKRFDFSGGHVTVSVEEDLKRLGVEHVDLVACHDVGQAELRQIVEETLPVMRKLREQGKVRFIGISGCSLDALRQVLDRADVDYVRVPGRYALNDTTLAEFVPYLQLKGVGIMNAAPLSMGLLRDGGPPPWHPAPAAVKELCAKAAGHCRARGIDIAQLALQFAVSFTPIGTTVVGMRSSDELAKNLAWIEEPIDAKLFREVREILRPVCS